MSPLALAGTPYSLDETSARIADAVAGLDEQVGTLRSTGKLSETTLKLYYGQTRFEQIAESNAIEGSTLTVGETKLAVTKGITISGKDPGYSRDAQALARAIDRLTELAQSHAPTTIAELKEIHELVLGDRPSAGHFRTEQVRITGSAHRPPRTWREVMQQIEQWQTWSIDQAAVPSVVRAAVLHAWLVHIHPFIDGNGRTARAVGNLQLIRGGYPPIIIRARKDRSRYLEALARSDEGDLSLFLDLILDRTHDALRDLERAASRGQAYDRQALLIQKAQERQLAIWNAAIQLVVEMLDARLHEVLDPLGASIDLRAYRDSLNLDEYVALCNGETISQAWAFRIRLDIPGLGSLQRLAWMGFRSPELLAAVPQGSRPAPSIHWSEPNPDRFPQWRRLQRGPGGDEFTLVADRWLVRHDSTMSLRSPLELADAIVADLLRSLHRSA